MVEDYRREWMCFCCGFVCYGVNLMRAISDLEDRRLMGTPDPHEF